MVVGMGGIGKTALAAKLVEAVQENFEYVQWRSLLQAPPIQDTLSQLLQSFPKGQDSRTDNLDQISSLIKCLRQHRCLLVLDNAESILSSGEGKLYERAGYYREGYKDYGELIRRIGVASHQSCLLITSREKFRELAPIEGETLPVRSLRLSGLNFAEGQAIFRAKGLAITNDQLGLVEHYAGNPLALKLAATTILDVFDGNYEEFLKQEVAVFGDIDELLEQHFKRLSDWEKSVMFWLAINRQPVSLSELREDITGLALPSKLIELLQSLGQRMLIEKKAGLFTLQPVVMEYVTAHLVQQVCQEIITQEIVLLASHALIKATAAYSIRKIQVRLILKPIADRLLVQFGSRNKLEDQLAQILARQRAIAPRAPGYLGGNVFNLLSLTKELNHFDFSDLSVWQADARNISLYQCNFTDADLAKSVFTEDFGDVLAVSLSPDGKQLAASATSGEIRLWYTSNGLQRLTLRGHTGWVRSIAFSPDGQTLVSSSSDHQIKLWNLLTGHLKTLQGHTNRVRTVTFSPDGQTLASGSDDQTIKLWDTLTGRVKRTLKGHTERVRSIAFRPDGQVLASASDDQIIKLWDSTLR